MKILLLGRNGQVGWELNRSLLPLGELIALDRGEVDLTDAAGLRGCLREIAPAVIVNAAAYTAVDRAEEETALAQRLNADAPAIMAEEAARRGALLIHYSTDYVFDGDKPDPYDERDRPAPLNVYGHTKLAGERAIGDSGADHLLLRTSWVYASRASNFMLTMLRLLRERDRLGVVADQIGAPTWARLIADTTAQLLGQALAERDAGAFTSGLYHLTAAGSTSWHGFTEEILAQHNRLHPDDPLTCRVDPITTGDYPTPARRPRNSRLSVATLEQRFGLRMPDWREALARCMAEI